jgi:glycosyltransferase involved in cell wall biosynthesis
MKVLYLNTTDVSGGAAVIVQRLMRTLESNYMVESRMLVRNKFSDNHNTAALLSGRFSIITEKILDRITRRVGLLYQTFPFSSKNLIKLANDFHPDVISLHNTHGGYFAIPLLEKLSAIAPVVWTLHDMWSFSGNASHTFGNTSWKILQNDKELKSIPPSIGLNTGAYLLRQKRRIYAKSNLTIITPSYWLKSLAQQSPVFEGKTIHHVLNGIDLNVYKPGDKKQARTALGVPTEGPTVIFSSHILDKNNPWKGGTDLLQILRKLNDRTTDPVNFLVLGEGKFAELDEFSNFRIFRKGYIKDEKLMIQCLQAADLFIYPTRADNLPNVLIEAVACGTPCITFDIGGNSEIIKDGYNGIIIAPFDFDLFAAKTTDLLTHPLKLSAFSSNCAKSSLQFDLKLMANSYISIFRAVSSKT